MGVFTLARGYLSYPGVPNLARGTFPGQSTPGIPVRKIGRYLPPHGGQSENITSRRTTYAGGKYWA